MKPIIKITLFVLVVMLVGAGSFYLGKHQTIAQATATPTQVVRKLLYYRNPMGLPDTSPIPKKDVMGMDYVPVYEGEESGGGAVMLSPEKVQLLGVRSEAVQRRDLTRSIRATGLLEADERRQQWIAPRFEGWVQQLQVNATGQHVARGQALLTVYSPELESAAREVQLAHESGLTDVEKSARSRLDNWQIAAQDLEHLQHGMAHLVLRSPIDGVVIEKMAVEGARFAPGDVLFKLADLSSLWLQAEVAEQDQGALQVGQAVEVSVDAYAAEKFQGKISFIAPVLNDKTRTVRVRVELPNKDMRLRLGMYAKVVIADTMHAVLAVPLSAVIDSGTYQVVLVRLAAGRFEPREVKLGNRGDNYVEVVDGVKEGEQVVTSANFLIDAESSLKSALSGFSRHTVHVDDKVEARSFASVQAEQPKQEAAKTIGHRAQGVLERIDADGTVSIAHEPIRTLGWPGMTMEFTLANSALVKDIPVGSAITFEIVERGTGVWVITSLQAVPQASAVQQHKGH